MSHNFTDLLSEEVASYGTSEWTGALGSATVTLYSTPLSPKTMEAVRRRYADVMTNPSPAAMVEIIILKALDKDGKRVFNTGEHRVPLNNLDVNKIGEIFGGLFGDSFEDNEEADAKN